ncbi:hypothetical protein [Aeoliella sp. SH292]|uniref:hypothetical protein n=1 Tax=Aeoliella sp. SH292 TaxID=3454464 RepID=UPI003F987781
MRCLRLCALMVACAGGGLAWGEKLDDQQLGEKAERLQAVVEEKVLQQHGMVPMLVRASDYQLPTAKDYEGAYQHRHLQGKTEAELGLPPMHVWRAWENTPSDTAYYLYAMAHKYRVTGDPETLEVCRRTFGALKYIHQLGVEKGERGFLPKPYGGVYSNQTAGDQLQCVTWGLAAYRPIAPPDDARDLDQMVSDFALHQMETDYINLHGYFGKTREQQIQEKQEQGWRWKRAAIYLPTLYLAWDARGDDRFVTEIERLNSLSSKSHYRVATDRFSTNGFGGKRDLYLPSYLMQRDPARHEVWREAMRTTYQQASTGVLGDGTWPSAWRYDSKRGGRQIESMPTVGGGVGRTGRSAIFAMGCVSAQRWFKDPAMQRTARHILEQLDEPTLRFILPLDDDHPLPDEWVVESEMLDLDSLTGWLAAYWEGRFRGYW